MLDLYAANSNTGSFVLIDAESNATVAAGIVRELLGRHSARDTTWPSNPEERARRRGHAAAHLALTGTPEYADAVERALL